MSSPFTLLSLHEGREVLTWVCASQAIAYHQLAVEVFSRLPDIADDWGINEEQSAELQRIFTQKDFAALPELLIDLTHGSLWFTLSPSSLLSQSPRLPSAREVDDLASRPLSAPAKL